MIVEVGAGPLAEFHRPQAGWFLEGSRDRGQRLERFALLSCPFTIGRGPEAQLPLVSRAVSLAHAEISLASGQLWVRDLGSRNGTFLNGQRLLSTTQLRDGDRLHFADLEFRLTFDPEPLGPPEQRTEVVGLSELPRRLPGGRRELRQLLEEAAVETAFQAIVALDNGERLGWEALGRGRHPLLPRDPKELLDLATTYELASELSALFRARAQLVSHTLASRPTVFYNTHPDELADPAALLAGIEQSFAHEAEHGAVLEIHEASVTNLEAMRELRMGLTELGVGLAYDDFGAGRARLLDLVEIPPDYLKFDISIVGKLDQATSARLRLVEGLVTICRELGIEAIAEGVETAGEAEAARGVGFRFAQGYFFGLPKVVDNPG